jgi:MerR family transcriptional regulator, redox-sensitive transcriptional activator SoxR
VVIERLLEKDARSLESQVNLKSSPQPIADDPAWTIGQLAARAGVATSALRFWEQRGLLGSARSGGGHRLYPRSALRRVAFIRAAQAVGLGLDDIAAALASLPAGRTPTVADWQRLSAGWQPLLDTRIAALTALRDRLASCIGCGCLSLERCRLYNPGDEAAAKGPGARYLMGDRPAEG